MTTRTTAPADVDIFRTKATTSRRPTASRRTVQSQPSSGSQPSAPWDAASPNSVLSSSNDFRKSRSHRLPEPPSESNASPRRGRSLPVARDGEKVNNKRREGKRRSLDKDRDVIPAAVNRNGKERVELRQSVTDAAAELIEEVTQRRSTPTRPNPLLGNSSTSPPPIWHLPNGKSSSSLQSGSRSPSRPNPLLAGSPQRKLSREPFFAARAEASSSTTTGDHTENTFAVVSRNGKPLRPRGRSTQKFAKSSVFEPAAFLESMVSAPSHSAEVLTSMFSPTNGVEEQARHSTRRQSLTKGNAKLRSPKKIDVDFEPGSAGITMKLPASGVVTSIKPDSQAATAGVEEGWQITAVNGQAYSPELLQTTLKGTAAYRLSFKKLKQAGVDNTRLSSARGVAHNRSSQGSERRVTRINKLAPWDTPDFAHASTQDLSKCDPAPKDDEAESPPVYSCSERPKLSVPGTSGGKMHPFASTPSFDHDDAALGTADPEHSTCTADFGDSDEDKSIDEKSTVTLDPAPQRTLGLKNRSKDVIVGFAMSPVREVSTPSSSPAKKVALSAFGSRAPVVRLTRIHDLSLVESRSLGVTVPAYSLLGQRLHEQRMLRSKFQLHNLDFVALLRWYVPYCLVAFAYSGIVQLAGGFSQTLLFTVPLFIMIPLAHCVRLAKSDHQLHTAVDAGAIVEFQAQIKSLVESSGVIAATLGSALPAFRKTSLRLIKLPRMQLSVHTSVCASAILVLLLCLRAARALTDMNSASVEVEALTTYVAMIILVLVGCWPYGVRDRAWEADIRLLTLEAGFNCMLDSLRPLMGDLNGGILPSPMFPTPSGNPLLSSMLFPVRLISTDRNTLRAYIHAPGDSSKLVVSCPLGNFALTAERVQSVFPTILGISAANPTLWNGGMGSPSSGQGLSAMAATVGINLGGGRQRRREDDEYSTSLASVSTASTLKRIGGNQPSEASLKLAMNMVAELNRHGEPLEAFRAHQNAGMVPPKAPVDEPSLLFALLEDHVRFMLSAGPDHTHSAAQVAGGTEDGCRSCCSRQCAAGALEAEDRFGVLRSRDSLERLCTSPPTTAGTPAQFGTPSRPTATPLGRFSDSDSDGFLSDEEPKPNPADTYIKETCGEFSKHLAVLFDSVEERDRCLALFEMSGYGSHMGCVEP